jgi:hypothetical protein
MTLYELIYGIDIKLDIGENKNINIQNWVPSRDGYFIDISNYDIITQFKTNKTLGIKLYLDYENTNEKEQLLKQYFS